MNRQERNLLVGLSGTAPPIQIVFGPWLERMIDLIRRSELVERIRIVASMVQTVCMRDLMGNHRSLSAKAHSLHRDRETIDVYHRLLCYVVPFELIERAREIAHQNDLWRSHDLQNISWSLALKIIPRTIRRKDEISKALTVDRLIYLALENLEPLRFSVRTRLIAHKHDAFLYGQ